MASNPQRAAKAARKPRKTAADKADGKPAKSKPAAKAAKSAKTEEDAMEAAAPVVAAALAATEEVVEDATVRPNRRKAEITSGEVKVSSTAETTEAAPKKGWWQRKGFF